jgi:hypothetical protein
VAAFVANLVTDGAAFVANLVTDVAAFVANLVTDGAAFVALQWIDVCFQLMLKVSCCCRKQKACTKHGNILCTATHAAKDARSSSSSTGVEQM